MRHSLILALAALTSFAFDTASAALNIGDAAPNIKVAKWVKGGPIASLETNKVYVVEFWATWCGPCRQSIPHLTEMAHTFKDKATFVGVDVMEQNEAAVVKFVGAMAEKMDYNVAIDTEETFMANEWMRAADQHGIPTAFIVDQTGRIAWIGHPMAGLDKALAAVVDGKWNLVIEKKRVEAYKMMNAVYAEASKGADQATLEKKVKEIEALDSEIGGLDPEQKFDGAKFLTKARFEGALDNFRKAVSAADDSAKIDQLEAAAKAAAPKDYDFEKSSSHIKLSLGADKAQALFKNYFLLAQSSGNSNQIAEVAGKMNQLQLKDPSLLNKFAWALLTDKSIQLRDLPLALKLAENAVEASEGKDSAILDTYARALFDSGKIVEAVDCQKRAVAASTDKAGTDDLTETLKQYEAALSKAK